MNENNSNYSNEENNQQSNTPENSRFISQIPENYYSKNNSPTTQDEHSDTKQVVDTAAKGVAEHFAPGIGGKAYDMAKKIPGTSQILDKATSDVAKKADKIPGVKEASQGLNQSGATNMANEAINMKGNKGAQASRMPQASENPIPNFRKNGSLNREMANNAEANGGTPNPEMGTAPNSEAGATPSPRRPLSSLLPPDLTNPQASNKGKGQSGPNASDILSKGLKSFYERHKIPIILGGMGIAFFFLIIFTVMGGDSKFNSNFDKMGLYGYPYYKPNVLCDKVTIKKKDGTYTREFDFEKEYIPGVIYAEVGEFTDSMDTLKTFAIMSRTYALRGINNNTEEDPCVLPSSSSFQNMNTDENVIAKITAEDNIIAKATAETYGLILVKNNEIGKGNYDMACLRSEDDENYYIGYGSNTIGTEQLQPIPKSWDKWTSRTDFISYVDEGRCEHGHAYGASQIGAYYLNLEKGYDYLDILAYYNGEDSKIMSIYESVSDNYTLATSRGRNDIIDTNLRDYLRKNGSNVNEFNEHILANVLSVGPGTRAAAVAVAISMVGDLYQMYGVRLPYTLCGQRQCSDFYNSQGVNINKYYKNFYGVDPDWGTPIHNSNCGNSTYYNYGDNCTVDYKVYGPECAGFVSWILHNAGFNAPGNIGSAGYGDLNNGEKIPLKGEPVGQPGDLLWHSGHIQFIIGVDEINRIYYIAHASCEKEGTKISTVSFSDSENFVVDMTDWYANNKLNVTPEEFANIFRAGMLQ